MLLKGNRHWPPSPSFAQTLVNMQHRARKQVAFCSAAAVETLALRKSHCARGRRREAPGHIRMTMARNMGCRVSKMIPMVIHIQKHDVAQHALVQMHPQQRLLKNRRHFLASLSPRC